MVDEDYFLKQFDIRNGFRRVPIRPCNCDGVGRFCGGRDNHAAPAGPNIGGDDEAPTNLTLSSLSHDAGSGQRLASSQECDTRFW